jgi:arginyl-tRNA synthetase
MNFKEEFVNQLSKHIKLSKDKILNLIEIPKNDFGDLAFPVFSISKNPNKTAEEIANKLSSPSFEKFQSTGPYINAFIKKEKLIQEILTKESKIKQNKIIVIESPGPNTNKPLHLGHLRNMALGISLSNINKHLGNKVINVDIINDRGIHICKSMLAYKLYGKNKSPDKKSDHFVGDYYVLFSKKEISEEKAQEMLIQWENKDKETLELWKKMNKWAIDGMHETYNDFGMHIDKTYYESQHYLKGKNIILNGLKDNIFQKDEDGSVIADLGKLGKKVLLRADGTSIYITQDIYLAKQRYEDFKFDKMIYIVGSEQIHHFNALFEIFKKLKYKFADNCHHLSYGMVYLPEGKMKSREGKIVDADDLIEGTTKLAKEKIKEREKNLSKSELEKRAKSIAISSIKFLLLKYNARKDFVFNPNEALAFEGESGAYVLYTYARISSILKKAKKISKPDYKKFNELEYSIVKKISRLNDNVMKAKENYSPNIICNYLIELCQLFNSYYSKELVIGSDTENEKLNLLKKLQETLKTGMNLLGMKELERM